MGAYISSYIVIFRITLGTNITIEDNYFLAPPVNNVYVNENGNVPVMMYHGIVDKKDSETPYTGGNADRDGYARTSESFRRDLEFYYNEGYRMVRLIDYVNGDIDVEDVSDLTGLEKSTLIIIMIFMTTSFLFIPTLIVLIVFISKTTLSTIICPFFLSQCTTD